MKISRVRLTKHEAQWFSRNVIKTIQSIEEQSKSRPELLERGGYKTLVKIRDQAVSIADELTREAPGEVTYDISLSRKQKLALRAMIETTLNVLAEKILPEYQRRSSAEPEQYKQYVSDTEMKVELLKKMARKFK